MWPKQAIRVLNSETGALQDPAAITRLKKQLGLECVCIVGNISVNPKGMGLCDPAERDGFLAEVRASADAARRFETKRLVVLTGNKVSSAVARAAARKHC